MQFNVVIIGGGTAGCVLASRLSEDPGQAVCLVEAGPDYGPYAGGGWPEDMVDGRQLAFSHSWETDREDRSQLRARILGGCSGHNACVVLEGAPADYDAWGPGWTYRELEPYLRRAERQLRTRRPTDDELLPWGSAFLQAGGDASIVNPLNAVGSVRWNAAFAYLDPARNRPNLAILADTLGDRVLLDGERAVGVATSAGELTADTVMLTASSYGSPAILLRSGIGRIRDCRSARGWPTTSESVRAGSQPSCSRTRPRASRASIPSSWARSRLRSGARPARRGSATSSCFPRSSRASRATR